MWLGLFVAVIGLSLFWSHQRHEAKWKTRLTRILESISEGRMPSGFLLGVEPDNVKIGLLLEKIYLHQRSTSSQLLRDASNLQAVLSSMLEGVLVLDSSRRIELHNPALLRMWELKEIVPRTSLIETFQNIDVEWLVRDVCDQQTPITRDIEVQIRKSNKNETLWFQVGGVPLKSNKGEMSGLVLVFHDITRLKQLESIRTEFVGNVSHELRTPLAIFRGYLETLLNTPDISRPEFDRILRIMQRHSHRLNALVEDLLMLARLESKAMRPKYETLSIHAFLEQIRFDWARRLSEKKLELVVQIEPKDLQMRVDPLRLEQIFSNLLDNAVKYTLPDTAIRITVQQDMKSREIELRVSDQGPGIPPDDLPHIFERFYRVDKGRSRDLGGTGLGLSIVKHMVQMHEGRVYAESVYGSGTTIVVRLPENIPS